MRNTIIHLGLIVALLTTSPLLAMDVIKDEDSKASIKLHTCPSCVETRLFTLTELEATNGKGSMHPIPNDIMSTIIIQSEKGAVAPLMYVSRHMYNLCHEPSVWRGFAQKEEFLKFEPKLCPNYQVNHFYTLFRDNTQHYKVTASQLIHFKKNYYCIENEKMKKQEEERYEFRRKIDRKKPCKDYEMTYFPVRKNSWLFTIGNRKLVLYNTKESDDDFLSLLPADTVLTFLELPYWQDSRSSEEGIRFTMIDDHKGILNDLEDRLKDAKRGTKEDMACWNNVDRYDRHGNLFKIIVLPNEEKK